MPEGWAWIRIKDIVNYIGDGDWIESKDQSSDGIRLIQTGNIGFGKFKDKEGKYHYITEKTFDALQCNEIFAGDILISRLPEPVGRACIIPCCAQRMITAVDCTIIRLSSNVILKEYFIYYTQSKQYLELIKQNCTGTTRLRISRANLEKIFVPLPPIKEQKKIMDIINEQFSFIEEIENNKEELQTSIKQAKSKILDLAIHGKLVPQDPSDEPAEEILKRIATSDNRPYEKFDESQIEWELPDNWSLCHLGDIITVINGRNQKDVVNPKGKYPIYGSGGIMGYADDFICLENCTIIGRKGSINNPIFVKEKFWNVDTAFGLSPSDAISPKYLFYFCEYFDFTSLDSSTTLPSLTKTNIQQIVFALPPLPEQERILGKIDILFSKLDEIVLNLV